MNILLTLLLSSAFAAPAAPASGKKAPAAAEVDYEDANAPATGGIVKFGERVLVLEGEQVDGPVVSVGGSVQVDGTVNGPVVSLGGSTELGPRSEVNGPVVSIGGKTSRAAGSRVEGPLVDTPGYRFFGSLAALFAYLAALSAGLFLLAKVSASLGWIVVGVVLLSLFPDHLRATKSALEDRAKESALLGILFWPAFAVSTATFCLSLIGIPLAPVLLVLAAAAYVWGFSALALFVGERLSRGRWDSPFAAMLLGMLVLKFLQWLPLIKWLVLVAAAVFGVGAAVLSRFGFRRQSPA